MKKRDVRIGQTDEDRDWAAEVMCSIPWLGAPGTGSYAVDVGVDTPLVITVTDVPLDDTSALYKEAKRRSPSFRCALLYSEPKADDKTPRISFDDFIAGKPVPERPR